MKKDIDKLLKCSIETYSFLLILVLIIKLLGGNYFEIATNSKNILTINNIISKFSLENIWYAITIYINVYIIVSITCNDNSIKMKKYILLWMPFIIFIQCIKTSNFIFLIIDYVYMLLIAKIYNKNKASISNYTFISVIIMVFQLLSIATRNQHIDIILHNFIVNLILNFDFILMLIIFYKYYFMKGANSIWEMVVYSFSHLWMELKNLLKKLHKKSQNKKSKVEKISNAIYVPIYILFNIFTLLVIFIIAFLNDAFIEAIFITLAFWINKKSFGKPYHCKSVLTCFVVSSLTYYALTRITLKVETSLFIPIFLGVGLSYFTSHLVKEKFKKKLYRGMPLDEFYELITKVTDNQLTIKMLKEFYVDREKREKIAIMNSYCIESFQKKKKKINDLIEELEI